MIHFEKRLFYERGGGCPSEVDASAEDDAFLQEHERALCVLETADGVAYLNQAREGRLGVHGHVGRKCVTPLTGSDGRPQQIPIAVLPNAPHMECV